MILDIRNFKKGLHCNHIRPEVQYFLDALRNEFGPGFSISLFDWFAESPGGIAILAIEGGRCLGSAFGAPMPRIPDFYRQLAINAFLFLCRHPRSMGDTRIWASLGDYIGSFVARLTPGTKAPRSQSSSTMRLIALSAPLSPHGRDIQTQLLDAFDEISRSCGMQHAMYVSDCMGHLDAALSAAGFTPAAIGGWATRAYEKQLRGVHEQRLSEPAESGAMQEMRRIRQAYLLRTTMKVADRYSHFNAAHLIACQGLERQLIQAFRACGIQSLGDKRVLDVGCGTGYMLRQLIQWGLPPENATGIDLLDTRIEVARSLTASSARFFVGDLADLALPAQSYDIVLQMTVFSSILDPNVRQGLADEMRRVTADQGIIVWYDFIWDNPNNSDVLGIPKAEIRRLFPGCPISYKRLTLLPPLSRILAGYSPYTARALSMLPFLCSHYLAIITPSHHS